MIIEIKELSEAGLTYKRPLITVDNLCFLVNKSDLAISVELSDRIIVILFEEVSDGIIV